MGSILKGVLRYWNEKEGELKLCCMGNCVGQGQGDIWEEMRMGHKFGSYQ